MTYIWNKWISADKYACIVIALLYLFISLVIPLTHTCYLHNNYDHCACCADHCLVNSHTVLNNSAADTVIAHNQQCLACLYVLISKTFELSTNSSLYAVRTVVNTYALFESCFFKSLQWLCSYPLRAPPACLL